MGLGSIVTFPLKLAKKGIEKGIEKVKDQQKPKIDENLKASLKQNFVADLSVFLTSYGFDIEEAIKTSKSFYDSHQDKVRDVLAMF